VSHQLGASPRHPAVETDGVDQTESSILPDGSGVVDRPALLERYAEHQDLLFEIAGLFRAEAPRWPSARAQEGQLEAPSQLLWGGAFPILGDAAKLNH
jgi:hypothetical protein